MSSGFGKDNGTETIRAVVSYDAVAIRAWLLSDVPALAGGMRQTELTGPE